MLTEPIPPLHTKSDRLGWLYCYLGNQQTYLTTDYRAFGRHFQNLICAGVYERVVTEFSGAFFTPIPCPFLVNGERELVF